MLRSFFRGLALFIVILGLQFFVVDEFNWRKSEHEPVQALLEETHKAIEPAEHFPWMLVSVGSVIFLWTFTAGKQK